MANLAYDGRDVVTNTEVFDFFTTREFKNLAIQARRVHQDYIRKSFGARKNPQDYVQAKQDLPGEEEKLLRMLDALVAKHGLFYDPDNATTYIAYGLLAAMQKVAPALCVSE